MTKKEVIEGCPHCGMESIHTLTNDEIVKTRGKVKCSNCNEVILLCGECLALKCVDQPYCFEFAGPDTDIFDFKNEGITELAIDDHIRMAIEAERDRAAKLHGSVFNSHHEAWAVLVEEMEELREESERLTNGMDDLWHMVRHDQDPELLLVRMSGITKRFILEAIQVAAMIDKYSRTNELFNRVDES